MTETATSSTIRHRVARLVVLAALLLVAGCQQRLPEASAPSLDSTESVEVSSVARLDGADVALDFTIKNVATHPLVLDETRLPGGERAVTFLPDAPVVIRIDAIGPTVQQLRFVRPATDLDPSVRAITLQAGKSWSGRVHLVDHFPSLPAALRGGPVRIIWALEVAEPEGKYFGRHLGVLYVDRDTGN